MSLVVPALAAPGAQELTPGLAHKPAGDDAEKAKDAKATRLCRVLTYVHLRNIHGSTGAGRVARQLVEHLALRPEMRLRILADRADHARIVPVVGAPWSNFDYRFFAADTSRQQARWLALNRPFAESYWPEAEIVFCTGESYVPTQRARSVVTLHDAAYFEHDAHRRDAAFWKQSLKWRILYARLSRDVDIFHTVSQFSADRLAHFFPAMRDRLRVVPNAVSPHFFLPVTDQGRLELAGLELGLVAREGGDGPLLLVPGGLHFRKNAELILDGSATLLARFPRLRIAVVNHSDPAYAAQAASLGERFRLLGFVSDPLLRALYAAATAVWFPSRYEGFGLPVIEAMACGAPVVASRASSLPEIAGDAALLVEALDAAKHVEAITSLLTEERAAEDLAQRGLGRAAAFTWEASAARLASHFQSLL